MGFMEERKGLKRVGGWKATRLCLCSRSEVQSSAVFLELNRFFSELSAALACDFFLQKVYNSLRPLLTIKSAVREGRKEGPIL